MKGTPNGNTGANRGQAPKGNFVWRKNVDSSEPADWSRVNADKLRATISIVTGAGAALMCGVTSDGGAYSICVLDQQQKIKEYPHTAEECEALLDNIREYYTQVFTG